jgi:hypothetical protein
VTKIIPGPFVKSLGGATPPKAPEPPTGGATITSLAGVRGARTRMSNQDLLKMFGPNSEGTLAAFDASDLHNVARADKGLSGGSSVALYDPGELATILRRGRRREDYWDEGSIEEFDGRARAAMEGYDIELERVPYFEGTVNPESGAIQIFVHDLFEETLETAFSMATLTGSKSRKMPMQINWTESPIDTLQNTRGLNGRVEFVDAESGEILRRTSLGEIEFPNAPELRAFVDPDLERLEFVSEVMNPANHIENVAIKNQPRSDAQARDMVSLVYSREGMTLAMAQGDAGATHRYISDAITSKFTELGIDPSPYMDDSTRMIRPAYIGALLRGEATPKFNAQMLLDKPPKDLKEQLGIIDSYRETQRVLDDWHTKGVVTKNAEGEDVLRGGLLRRMEETQPERYAALKEYVADTPWTRGNIYGRDVEFPDDPIFFYHGNRFITWEDGRQYLQEGKHARETGVHLGTHEQSGDLLGFQVLEPWPSEVRSPFRHVDNRTKHLADGEVAMARDMDYVRGILVTDNNLFTRTEVDTMVMELIESRWASEATSGGGSTLRAIDTIVDDMMKVVKNRDVENKVNWAMLRQTLTVLVNAGSRHRGQMMMQTVVGAKRPFRMWDHGSFSPTRVLHSLNKSDLLDEFPDLRDRVVRAEKSGTMSREEMTEIAHEALETLGFDSIVYNNTVEAQPMPSIIVWRPELIKPVHEAQTFDKGDPRRAMGVVPLWFAPFMSDGEE